MHVRSQDDIAMVGDMGIAIPLSAHSLVAVHFTKVWLFRLICYNDDNNTHYPDIKFQT